MGTKQGRHDMASKPGIQLGYFTCIFCKETFVGDKRRVCCDNPECQEKQYERRKERSRQLVKKYGENKIINNPCIICGKDKGANRFYCRKCHSRLTNEYGPGE